MSQSAKSKIISRLVSEHSQAGDDQLFQKFLGLFLSHVSEADIQSRSLEDFYGEMLAAFNLLRERKVGEHAALALNPDVDKVGWQSDSTVLFLVFEDMPFVVDSIRNLLNRMHCHIHLCINRAEINTIRDAKGRVIDISEQDVDLNPKHTCTREACLLVELNRQPEDAVLAELKDQALSVLEDVRIAVRDWRAMQEQMRSAAEVLASHPAWKRAKFLHEQIELLNWLENYFTFIGYRRVKLVEHDEGKSRLHMIKGSGLGVLSDDTDLSKKYGNIPEHTLAVLSSTSNPVIISKTSKKSTIHRDVYTDYIAVKILNEEGKVVGAHQFVGLFTSDAYDSDPSKIPLLRTKLNQVLETDMGAVKGYTNKRLIRIVRNLPREEMFQSSVENLRRIVNGIFVIQGRREVKLFTRVDSMQRFVSFILVLPRDNWTTHVRIRVEEYLVEVCNGLDYGLTPTFDESGLVHVHIVVRVDPKKKLHLDEDKVQSKVKELVKSWEDSLIDAVVERYGNSEGYRLYDVYRDSFPAGYRETYSAREAAADIDHIQRVLNGCSLELRLFQPLHCDTNQFHLKVFERESFAQLSIIMPVLENMGLRVIEDTNYLIQMKDCQVTLSDFTLAPKHEVELDLDELRDRFLSAFMAVRSEEAENDALNALTLYATMTWREVSMLRAYVRHARQSGFQLTGVYIYEVLCRYPAITQHLVKLFHHRFDPEIDRDEAWEKQGQKLCSRMDKLMESVNTLDEDRIFRRLHASIKATLRTNYYQRGEDGANKAHITYKFLSENLPDLPLPRPKIETWVYSPAVEGIHLRSDWVARGGLRWSDRRDDFRTEVLGLMKAQKVKNSLIVPSGAKGGFFTKKVNDDMTRDEFFAEGVTCYRVFINGLLDITDNVVNGKVVKPEHVVCYDDDDYYLVVAADKGTATFSDFANAISTERGFWLKDAFASGGSNGYDHKAMGITAKGAWEAVIHHFNDLGMDPAKDEFTVVGIGGMNGDVFGNGMLLSDKIKLVAAFNAQWIFIDPTPNPAKSFAERKRMFDAQTLDWPDYNSKLISKGGGVYSRASKKIELSQEVVDLFDLPSNEVDPNTLIRAILLADVDLLWNGGIGTYIKASTERDEDAMDKSNDAVRVDARDLRIKVIGEGGNLGATQLGRIEFAMHGGHVNTDFIDNSAGVDCSDHEVNLKILLNKLVSSGEMTERQRNELMAKLTDDVANLVLENNRSQNALLSMMSRLTTGHYRLYNEYIKQLEKAGELNPQVEFLPTEQQIETRLKHNDTYSRPELAVLMSYSKLVTKHRILAAPGFDDPVFESYLYRAFPETIMKRYGDQVRQHELRHRIIANELTNQFISELGMGFVELLHAEMPCSLVSIFKAYLAVRELFEVDRFNEIIKSEITGLDNNMHVDLMLILRLQLRKSIRWLLRHGAKLGGVDNIARYADDLKVVSEVMSKHIDETKRSRHQQLHTRLLGYGCSEKSARFIANMTYLGNALNLIESAKLVDADLKDYVGFYYCFEEQFNLNWLRYRVSEMKAGEDHWQVIAKATMRGQLETYHRELSAKVYKLIPEDKVKLCSSYRLLIEEWLLGSNDFIRRWVSVINDIKAMNVCNFQTLVVAINELEELNNLLTL